MIYVTRLPRADYICVELYYFVIYLPNFKQTRLSGKQSMKGSYWMFNLQVSFLLNYLVEMFSWKNYVKWMKMFGET